jgi:hypothetical protein
MQKIFYLFSCCTILFFVSNSCQKPLPNGGKPFYIVIDTAEVEITSPSSQGSASSKIEQVWVEVGGQNLGVYPLPIKFPVLDEPGTYPLLIQAGIKNKGIAAQRQIYQMLQSYKQDITFDAATNTYHIKPIFKYKTACTFAMNESFEFSNNFDLNMNVTSDSNVYEGANSGVIDLAPSSGKTAYTNSMYIPVGRVAYIELNYKTDMPFSIGLSTTSSSSNTTEAQFVVADTKSTWNKMYIDITPEITSLNTENYKFYLKSYNDDSTNTKHVYIDNFKVIYF